MSSQFPTSTSKMVWWAPVGCYRHPPRGGGAGTRAACRGGGGATSCLPPPPGPLVVPRLATAALGCTTSCLPLDRLRPSCSTARDRWGTLPVAAAAALSSLPWSQRAPGAAAAQRRRTGRGRLPGAPGEASELILGRLAGAGPCGRWLAWPEAGPGGSRVDARRAVVSSGTAKRRHPTAYAS
ncbi:unnamed protein product, partial [Prorocentrum cordatum]